MNIHDKITLGAIVVFGSLVGAVFSPTTWQGGAVAGGLITLILLILYDLLSSY